MCNVLYKSTCARINGHWNGKTWKKWIDDDISKGTVWKTWLGDIQFRIFCLERSCSSVCWWSLSLFSVFSLMEAGQTVNVQCEMGWRWLCLHATWYGRGQLINGGLQSLHALFGSSTIPDNNGWCENGLHNGSGELDQHCLGQVELLHLPQGKLPLFNYRACVYVTLEMLGVYGTKELTWLYN